MSTINNYETVMILNTKLGDEAIAGVVEKFKALISAHGTIENVEEWGKRKLAYPIEDEIEGHYVLITFSSDAAFTAELNRIYNITDGVLRSLIIKKEA